MGFIQGANLSNFWPIMRRPLSGPNSALGIRTALAKRKAELEGVQAQMATFNIGDIVFWRDFNYKCTDGRLVTETTLTGVPCQRANLIFEGVILGIEDKYSARGQSFYKVATIQESGGEIREIQLKQLLHIRPPDPITGQVEITPIVEPPIPPEVITTTTITPTTAGGGNSKLLMYLLIGGGLYYAYSQGMFKKLLKN